MKTASNRASVLHLWWRIALCFAVVVLASVLLSGCIVYESSVRTRSQQQFPQNGSPQNGYNPNMNPNGTPNVSPSYNPNVNPNYTQGMNGNGGDMDWQRGISRVTNFQTFYDELYPHGEWLNVPEYGFVWRPYNIDANWQPYLTNGRWIQTRYGWTWASNYSWGWAPFHYGRWRLDPYYGWYWVPGSVWGPAWVEWREFDGNYWWVPLAPEAGFGASFRGNFSYLPRAWNVVPARFFTDPFCQRYALPYSQFGRFVNNTTIINNVIVNNINVSNPVTYPAGPSIDDVSRYTGGKVMPYGLRNLNQAGASVVNDQIGNVSLFAPSFQTPAQTENATAMRPVSFTPAARATKGKAGFSVDGSDNQSTPPQDNTTVPVDIRPVPNAAPNHGSSLGTDGKSRPVAMPAPADTEIPRGGVGSGSSENTDPHVGGKKSASPPDLSNTPITPDNTGVRRYGKPSSVGIPPSEPATQQNPTPQESPRTETIPVPSAERKANPFEQPRQEQPRSEAPRQEQPRSEAPQQSSGKSNPFGGQPRYEAPRQEQPRSAAPQQSSGKSNPFGGQPRQEQPRYEAPKYEAPKYEAPQQSSGKSNPFGGQPRQEQPASTTPQPTGGKKGGGD
ncbi:MAG: hypothetical protein EAZ92_01310 [Candidatus Kapaibacterium sp.]|nr:MAG: hypothetical protein EAZ92_01310 [Candidatus Kapabacteria bacterium]